jgi:hypothetical protein
MLNSLTSAFARFGAKPQHGSHGRSAIAEDGALVLSCSLRHFLHPRAGVLRYEDSVAPNSGHQSSATLLGEHLLLARDGQLPIRMIVIAESSKGKPRYNIYARPDVIGRLIEFDGDHFVVDFTRIISDLTQPDRRRKRGG